MSELTLTEREQERQLVNLKRELAPVIPYFEMPSVTNIYIYGDGMLQFDDFTEGLTDTDINFSVEARKRIIFALASLNGITIDASKMPKLETVIPKWEIRTTAILPPWTRAPEITFRRPASKIIKLEEYVEQGRLTKEQYDLICSYLNNNKNIVISGSTGSGKTTFTNACLEKLGEYFPKHRFYIIEDVPELQFSRRYKTQVTIKSSEAAEAIKTALRWTPNHIIFGELRDGIMTERLLEAWNTGHPGNITTIHANTALSTLSRMEGLLKTVSEDSPMDVTDRVDVIIHINYKRGFGPIVDEVREMAGLVAEREQKKSIEKQYRRNKMIDLKQKLVCTEEEVKKSLTCQYMPDNDGFCILQKCVIHHPDAAPRFTSDDPDFEDEFTILESDENPDWDEEFDQLVLEN